jgi:hypothetical protein
MTLSELLQARQTEELVIGVTPARAGGIKAELATSPEIARLAAEREGGWEVYEQKQRHWARRYDAHPTIRRLGSRTNRKRESS